MKSLSITKIDCLKNLLLKGNSLREVAIALSLSIGTIHKYKKILNINNENINLGRPNILSETHK